MNVATEGPRPAHEGGWTVLRREVVDRAAGICIRCGRVGADTATRGWDGDALVAAHTRCVVGLGPPTMTSAGPSGLLAA
jgi:hypothetical protein